MYIASPCRMKHLKEHKRQKFLPELIVWQVFRLKLCAQYYDKRTVGDRQRAAILFYFDTVGAEIQ